MLDIDHDEDRVRGVFREQPVDFDIVGLELSAGGVPAYDFFSGRDLIGERFEFGFTFLNMAYMFSWNIWSRNQTRCSFGSSSKGTA